jgi:DNA-binding beta-propeller fold protein YncE
LHWSVSNTDLAGSRNPTVAKSEVTLGTNVEPDGVAADPANGMVYVDNCAGTQVYVVSEKTDSVLYWSAPWW